MKAQAALGKSKKCCVSLKGARIAFLGVFIGGTTAGSPAFAAPCDGLLDDTQIAACASQELEEQVNILQRAYEKLAEALGPQAAADLPRDQKQWLQRVANHCEIADDIKSVLAQSSRMDTAQILCLKRFVEARALDLSMRTSRAAQIAKRYSQKDYPAVQSTWGDRLNPGGKAPLGRFNAYYMRSGKPATLVATDTVGEVSINYPWADFHGIRSEDFEGYWVGQFRYEKQTPVYIGIDQSWSRTRVIIDRKLVYEGGNKTRLPFLFSPGLHTIEVEFINNWHTTGLSVTFVQAIEPIGRPELRAQLRALAPDNTVAHFAAVYESGSRDNSVVLKLAPSRAPIILVLNSYHAVRWVIDNRTRADLRAIVYSSFAPGTRIETKSRDSSVPRVLVAGELGSYDAAPRCNCVGGIFHCEGGNLNDTVNTLSSVLGFPVTGVSGEYSPQMLSVPSIDVTPEVMADARATMERLERKRNECRKTTRFE